MSDTAGHAKRGEWVRVTRTILTPDERAPSVPDDTRSTPFQLWMNGFLDEDRATIGDEVTISTAIGRHVRGRLVVIGPRYDHDFGEPQPTLLTAMRTVRNRMQS